MDPNATLAEIRALSKSITDAIDRHLPTPEGAAERLADLVQALDGWIMGGGFLPRAWAPGAAS